MENKGLHHQQLQVQRKKQGPILSHPKNTHLKDEIFKVPFTNKTDAHALKADGRPGVR